MAVRIAQVLSQHAFLKAPLDWSAFDNVAFAIQTIAQHYSLYLCRLSIDGNQAIVLANQPFDFQLYVSGQCYEYASGTAEADASFQSRTAEFLTRAEKVPEFHVLKGLAWSVEGIRQYVIS